MQTSLLLELAAESFPERAAFGSLDAPIRFGEFWSRAQAAAKWLQKMEAQTLVFIGLNGPSLPVAVFASALAGKPFAPLNYRLSDQELRRLLARTAPSIAIVDEPMMPRIGDVADVVLIERSLFDAAAVDPANQTSDPAPGESDIAVLLFTSGTTAEPKAAVLRHSHLTSYVISSVEFMSAEEGEAALISVPPYHIAGVSAVLSGAYSGRRIVYLAAFTPEAWVETAVREKITHAMVVPTMLGRILDSIEQKGDTLPDIRAISYGGGRMPQPVIERALFLLPHVAFVNAYGLTETSSTVAVLGPDDHRLAISSADPAVRRRLGSVGRPLPSLELEIRDPDGALLPPGASGEIYVRGDQVAGEYLHRKMLQDDGWFATNDAGWLDEAGYLFVEGRLDDVIVRGGENISPGEIEDVLRSHPLVRDVAVLGLPDDNWGERVAAVIVAGGDTPSVAELSEWVRSKLRSTKTPESWEFREELPYTETGKLLRRVLKSELLARIEP